MSRKCRYARGRYAHLICWLLAVGLLTAGSPCLGQPMHSRHNDPEADRRAEFQENRLTAVFIQKMTKYIEWPEGTFESPVSPFYLCLTGQDGFERAFAGLKDPTFKTHPMQIVQYDPANANDMRCHILVFNSIDREQAARILKTADLSGVLTVGRMDGFAQMGGAINFYKEMDMLRFEINVDAVKRAGLSISANLLKLARIVRDPKE